MWTGPTIKRPIAERKIFEACDDGGKEGRKKI